MLIVLILFFLFGLVLILSNRKHPKSLLFRVGIVLTFPLTILVAFYLFLLWADNEKQKGANVNNCEIIEAYEIDLHASFLPTYGILLPSETFNDSLTPTKRDTVLALKKAYNCD